MTIGAWILFGVITIAIIEFTAWIIYECNLKKGRTVVAVLIGLLLIAELFFGLRGCFSCTQSGQRALTDQKSDLNGGLQRIVTIYTADGKVLAKYEGKIDFEKTDGGYIKFDFEGKRYIYYNCFVESIADIQN